MDGVLSDFTSGALDALNKKYNKRHTIVSYAADYGKWDIASLYGITDKELWSVIKQTEGFWMSLKPLPWFRELYAALAERGEVTILTTPSWDPDCAKQKLQWLKMYLGVNSEAVMMGARKELLAGNGLLIDDSEANFKRFIIAGGDAVLVPSNWNTIEISFLDVWNEIERVMG